MITVLLQLVMLFFVIFDPPASMMVFLSASGKMSNEDRKKMRRLALMVATLLSFSVLALGNLLLKVFNTSIDEFRVAGGIILAILGIKMALGMSLHTEKDSTMAIASIIGTPLLTGPAAITAIIVASSDFGFMVTGLAIGIVLFMTAVLFRYAEQANRLLGVTGIQIMSTVLGLVTLSWGVRFIATGVVSILGA